MRRALKITANNTAHSVYISMKWGTSHVVCLLVLRQGLAT